MAWQDIIRVPLRVYINDIDSTTYTDSQLDQVMLTAASYVIQEVRLNISYTVNWVTSTLSPDPSTDSTFINFIVLKSACLIWQWDFKVRSLTDGINAVLGPVRVASESPGSNVLMAFLNDGPCKMYDELRMQNNMGGNANDATSLNVSAILSPFTHEDSDLYRGIIENGRR